MRSILVTRPEPSGPELVEKLRREDFHVWYAPLSHYVPLNPDYGPLDGYQALVFTSSQAVTFFAEKQTMRNLPVFTVGDATARTARQAGFDYVMTASGNVQDLAVLLRQRKDEMSIAKILHISGEETAEDLGALLSGDNIETTRAIAYRLDFVDQLPRDIDRDLLKGDISTVLLFSARAAQQFMHILKRPDLKSLSNKLEAVCLSDRVAAELRGVPWRALRVAKLPKLDAVMDILRTQEGNDDMGSGALPADAIIEAFGGLRPLANRLDLTASTVQGWKKRGMIPEARADAVIQAAREDGIDITAILTEGPSPMTDNGENTNPPSQQRAPAQSRRGGDRRHGSDRRQQRPQYDDQGKIRSKSYEGQDRRTGIDRRAYEEEKQKRIRAEKWRFMNRTVLMSAFFFISIIYGAAFLMAPEFFELKKDAARIDDYEKRLLEYEKQIQQIKLQQKKNGASLGSKLNHGIENLSSAVDNVKSTVGTLATGANQLAQSNDTYAGLQQMLQMLGLVQKLNSTEDGRLTLAQTVARLQAMMAGSGKDKDSLGKTVELARKDDKNLQDLTGGMSTQQLAAAALLLTMNEMRGKMNAERSFEQDFAIIEKFAGNDPAMHDALRKLEPYAKNGVLSRETLQKEFRAIAADIVMAKLAGEDASVRERVLERLGKYAKTRKIDDIQGNTPDAVVARAEKMMNNGDIKGAIRELQTLDGESAEAAKPWMEQAAGAAAADDSSAALMQALMQQMSGANAGSIQRVFSDIVRQLGGGGGALPMGGGASGKNIPHGGGGVYPLAP